MNKTETETISYDRVEFNDTLHEIQITGHFDDYLCGSLTAMEWTFKQFKKEWSIKVVVLTDSEFEDTFDRHLKSIWKFKNKNDYIKIKNIVIKLFDDYKQQKEYNVSEEVRQKHLTFK